MKQKKIKKHTKKGLKVFKESLLKIKAKLSEQISNVEKENLRTSQKDASGDLSSYTIHMADVATDNYDREFSLSRASGEQGIVYEIDEALKRIAEGNFGICLTCGCQIAKNRLKAVPYAKSCIKCQNDEESGEKKTQ